jgi:hypothetical protein
MTQACHSFFFNMMRLAKATMELNTCSWLARYIDWSSWFVISRFWFCIVSKVHVLWVGLQNPALDWSRWFVGLAYQGKDIVLRFIIKYSSLRDFGDYLHTRSIFYKRICERWYVGLCWNWRLVNGVMISCWRILVSLRGFFFFFEDYIFAWWNITSLVN